MSKPVVFEDRVPPGRTRRVLDRVVAVSGLVVVSELSREPRSWSWWSVSNRPGRVRLVSRVELAEAGNEANTVAIVLHENRDDEVVVFSPRTTATVRGWTHSFLAHPGVPEDLRAPLDELDLLSHELTTSLVFSPASNADVAELTRRVEALSLESRRTFVASAPGRDPSSVPTLAGQLPVNTTGDGSLVHSYLTALRDHESGIPLEWALRRVVGDAS